MPEDNVEVRAERQWSAGNHAAALSLYLEAWTSPDDDVADKILDLVEDWGDTNAALEAISAAAAAGNAGAYEALADLLIQLDRPAEAVSARAAPFRPAPCWHWRMKSNSGWPSISCMA